jgi:hypothetical protein
VLTDFYISFSAVCFTLLGLWLIVVQTRHAEWRGSRYTGGVPTGWPCISHCRD